MAGHLPVFHLIHQPVEIALIGNLAGARIFPAPFRVNQGFIGAEFGNRFLKLLFVEAVLMTRVKIESRGVVRFLGFVVNVRERYEPPNRVQTVTQRLRLAQIIHRYGALVPQKPCEDRGRVPVAANRPLENGEACVYTSPRHLVKIDVPMARLFGDQQAQFVRQLDDAAIMRIVNQPHEVRADYRNFDGLAVLFHAGVLEGLRGLAHGVASPSSRSYSPSIGSGRW